MSEKKRVNRYFHNTPKLRLIVTVESSVLQSVDELLSSHDHPCRRNRAEFVRLAIKEKLIRDAERIKQ